MAVGRMMDNKKGVLSIPKLLREIESNLSNPHENGNLILVKDGLEKLKTICAPILERRHKRIAHPSNVEVTHDPIVRDWNEAIEAIGLLVITIGHDFGEFDQAGFDDFWYESEMKGTDAEALMNELESSSKWITELKRRRKHDAFLSSLRDSGS